MKRLTIFLSVLAIAFTAFFSPLNPVQAENGEPDFASLFEKHGSVMLLIDSLSADIIYANQAAADFYGYPQEQLTGMKITAINALSPEETIARMDEAVRYEKNFFEFKHIIASGEIRDVQVYSYPYLLGNREVLFSIIHDVTAEKALIASNRKYNIALISAAVIIAAISLFSTSIVSQKNQHLKTKRVEIAKLSEMCAKFINFDRRMIYVKDEDLNYIFINNTLADYFDIDAKNVMGKDDFAIMEKDLAEKNKPTDREVLQKHETNVSKIRWRDRIFKLTKFPIMESGKKHGIGAYIEDITEEESKKRIENKISLRNEILVDVLTRDFSSAHEQLDYVLSQALRLTGSQFGYIYLYDEQNKEFSLNTWSSDVMDECRITKKQTIYQLEKTGLWGETVRQSRPIIDNDFEMPGEMKKGYPDGHVKIKRFMTVPVIIEGAVVAVVGLANKQTPYDDDDTNQTTILMSGVWNALERREGREQLQLILNSTAEGIYGLDKDMKCTFINAAGLKLLGYNTQEELLGRNMHDVIHHSWPDGSKMPVEDCQIWRSFMNGQGGSNDNEVFWKKDGSSFYSAYFSYPQVHEEAIIGGVVTFMDNTQRRANEEKIRFLSYRDPLTNLYNRRFFEEELKRVDVKINLPISIIMGDLNGLKMINDIFGHSAGDEFLKKAASAIRKACREADVVARVGGDEFAIVVTNTDAAGTQKIIERIKSALARQHINAIKSSISLGYATKEEPDQSLEQIVKLAGVAMFKDKSLNREKIDSEMLHTVIQILHDRFPHEKEHSEKMSRLCEEIGKKMKLSSAEIRKLRNAGYLHDIGKVVLSPEWLEPGAILDVEAQKEMENHPVVSFRILNLFDKTMEIAEIALNHHEYLDGSGYPNKISGEEIPLLSRILSVAEDFLTMTDYMSENSPQREKALETIKNLSGIKYDPAVVKALSEVV